MMYSIVPLLVAAFLSSAEAEVRMTAVDTPNDGGGSITLRWIPLVQTEYAESVSVLGLYRRDGLGGERIGLAELALGDSAFIDEDVVNRQRYVYEIEAEFPSSTAILGTAEGTAATQWFRTDRSAVFVAVVVFTGLLLWFTYHARSGRRMFIRRIAGLEAVEEAVGRATEMGKPIMYIPGISSMDDVATIASIQILAQVAKKAGEYGTRLMVPNRDPIVMAVAQEIVKESYNQIGRPDLYNHDDIYYVTYSQFGYAAAVSGIMLRERPATNFLLGMFYAESLILSETGNTTGAIQIAGTDSDAQLPFFITSCDYTLIGEELYAASVYLSREPMLLGSLKAQDYAKALLLALTAIGVVLSIAGIPQFARAFH
ncbi:hypothetical protein JXA88_09005 [Candidatus Fermentibacteria bacterium]|nr:hypothetical protein [Candidatus Fermentibacteria bacterium]